MASVGSKGLLFQLARLQLNAVVSGCQKLTCCQVHTQSHPLLFRATEKLYAEPVKKKKKIDPNIILEKEKRKQAKIVKEMKQLSKSGRKLKPIDEIETPFWLKQQIQLRQRDRVELSAEESERRVLLQKDWTRYKMKQHITELKALQAAQIEQQKALDELKKESKELYHQAIQMDTNLIPHTFQGPHLTPPIENYDFPDGEYEDITRKY